MNVEVALLPSMISPGSLRERSAVVLDVLRATTTIATALAHGAAEVRTFPDLDTARAAAAGFDRPKLLAGERQCVAPAGFDCGNSPREFTADRVGGKAVFLSTTNGTVALAAAKDAAVLLAGAVVNAMATAARLERESRDVTLVCAGTQGAVSIEDLLCAGAVIGSLMRRGVDVKLESDAAEMALRMWKSSKARLVAAFKRTKGGQNVIAAGLAPDLDACAQLDAFDVVAVSTADGRITRG
jgi:2-phosphosulfolactate phosphatase